MPRAVAGPTQRAPGPQTALSDTPRYVAPLLQGCGLEALVLDDVAFDRRRLIRACDRAGLPIRFTEVSTMSGLHRALESGHFDLAFIDYRLTDGDGLAAVGWLAEAPQHFAGAVIMLAGESDARVAVSAMKAGCTDYIAKSDLTPDSIRRAVLGGLERAALRHDLDQAQARYAALTRSLDRLAHTGCAAVEAALGRIAQGAAGSTMTIELRVIAAHVDALRELARKAMP